MKKLVKRVVLTLIVGVAVLSALGFLEHLLHEGYIGAKKLGFETEYQGIKIGDPLTQAVFYLGKPTKTEPTSDPEIKRYNFREPSKLTVIFLDEASDSIVAIGTSSSDYDIPDLKWLNGFTRIEKVVDRLGEPDSSIPTDEGVFRAVDYEKHNLTLIFSKAGLRSITVGRMPRVDD